MPLIPPNRVTAFPLKDDLQWYDPAVIFQPFDDIFGRGVVGSTDLQVIQNAPDGQISVNPGRGYVPYPSGGKRLFSTSVAIRSDAAEFQHAIGAYTGTPRVDRIVSKILDATLNSPDVLKGGVFDVLPGVPTAGATLANLSGAASVPSTVLLLGNVLVNGATIPTANIDSTFGTTRARARIGGGNSPAKPIQVNGAALTDRSALNLIAGSNISITAADNAAADSADVTISGTAPPLPWVKLFDFTVTTPKTSIDTFTDGGSVLLPSTYTTLVVYGRIQSSAVQQDASLNMTYNNDSTANYDNWLFYYDSTGGVQLATTGQTFFTAMRFNAANVNTGWGIFQITIPLYANTVGRTGMWLDGFDSGGGGGAGGTRRFMGSGNYHGNNISRIAFVSGAGNFVAGSRIQVWAIA